MLKCAIIDDEEFSVNSLLRYIKLLPRLDVVGVYTNPQEALEQVGLINELDLLFMDIDMPYISGIELARALRSKTKKLVFTTSHSQYAFDAFEVEGDAFLLKPFSFGKFSTTISRLFPVGMGEKTNDVGSGDDYFLVKNKEEDLRIIKVRYNEIIAFESAQNYVKIYLTNGKVLTAYLTLKDIMDIVGSRDSFKQFHRAFIVSTDCIDYIEGGTVKMVNSLCFTVGELYRESFSKYLSNKLVKTSRKR